MIFNKPFDGLFTRIFAELSFSESIVLDINYSVIFLLNIPYYVRYQQINWSIEEENFPLMERMT